MRERKSEEKKRDGSERIGRPRNLSQKRRWKRVFIGVPPSPESQAVQQLETTFTPRLVVAIRLTPFGSFWTD